MLFLSTTTMIKSSFLFLCNNNNNARHPPPSQMSTPSFNRPSPWLCIEPFSREGLCVRTIHSVVLFRARLGCIDRNFALLLLYNITHQHTVKERSEFTSSYSSSTWAWNKRQTRKKKKKKKKFWERAFFLRLFSFNLKRNQLDSIIRRKK